MKVSWPKSLKIHSKHKVFWTSIALVLCFKWDFNDLGPETFIFTMKINFLWIWYRFFLLLFLPESDLAKGCRPAWPASHKPVIPASQPRSEACPTRLASQRRQTHERARTHALTHVHAHTHTHTHTFKTRTGRRLAADLSVKITYIYKYIYILDILPWIEIMTFQHKCSP